MFLLLRPLLSALALGLSMQAAAGRVVLATVRGALNQPLIALGPDDFLVREAGQPREVLAARIADYPVIVLIDDGEGGRRDFEAIKKAAAGFIGRIGQRPVGLGTLSDPPSMLASFEDPRDVVLQKLNTAAPRAAANVPLASVANASAVIRRAEAPFAAIVVISATPADRTVSPGSDLLARIVDSHATVHVLARRDPAQPPAAEILREVTEQTRGQFTTVYSTASYQVALDHLADQMATEMMIEYLVAPNAPATSDVTLGVSVPGAKVVGLGVR